MLVEVVKKQQGLFGVGTCTERLDYSFVSSSSCDWRSMVKLAMIFPSSRVQLLCWQLLVEA